MLSTSLISVTESFHKFKKSKEIPLLSFLFFMFTDLHDISFVAEVLFISSFIYSLSGLQMRLKQIVPVSIFFYNKL